MPSHARRWLFSPPAYTSHALSPTHVFESHVAIFLLELMAALARPARIAAPTSPMSDAWLEPA